jgi:UDP-N-acetylglucosamine acyltransferase
LGNDFGAELARRGEIEDGVLVRAMAIHPTAVIESGAILGNGVTVGPFTYIDHAVRVGDGTVLGPHVTLLGHTTIGKNCQIHATAVVGDLPQDLSFQGGTSYVTIGDDCVIREGVTIHRGTGAETTTSVGQGCMLMANSHLAHNVSLGNRVIVANGALLAGYVQVGDQAFISGNCLVHQFARVGRLAMLSGGAALQKDLLPFCMTPALTTSRIMGLNSVGLRRAGMSGADRDILKQALTVLYRSQLSVPAALEKLADIDSPLVQEWCEFIKIAKFGICQFASRQGRLRVEQDQPAPNI